MAISQHEKDINTVLKKKKTLTMGSCLFGPHNTAQWPVFYKQTKYVLQTNFFDKLFLYIMYCHANIVATKNYCIKMQNVPKTLRVVLLVTSTNDFELLWYTHTLPLFQLQCNSSTVERTYPLAFQVTRFKYSNIWKYNSMNLDGKRYKA